MFTDVISHDDLFELAEPSQLHEYLLIEVFKVVDGFN